MKKLLKALLKAQRSLPCRRTPSPIPPLQTPWMPKKPSPTSLPLYQCRIYSFLQRSSLPTLRSFSSTSQESKRSEDDRLHFSDDTEQESGVIEWEEEEETESRIDDGGDGGGVVLQNIPWGKRVLSIAHEVLSEFSEDIKLFAFKISPQGYIYVRLDKLSNDYGCPTVEEIESYSRQYKKRLDEEGSKGEIPGDLALEVSSPGAERLLRIPDDLQRFYDFPMVVSYVEDEEGKSDEKSGVFFIDSIEPETGHCVWKLADVEENRDPSSKGRPMSRKLKDWRLKLPYTFHRKVTLYLEF